MYAVVSDIHGNLYALERVAEDIKKFCVDGIILLGDIIDYGMQSNEVIDFIRDNWSDLIICNLWGNHEKAIMTSDFSHFSSNRGMECAQYTSGILTDTTRTYLNEQMIVEGRYEFSINKKKVFAVHGSMEDKYWKSIRTDNVWGNYDSFDIVLSGHSHYSHFFSKHYKSDDPDRRNEHAVFFLNPGSVGQPRNHNPNAQYALIDFSTMEVVLRSIPYDVESAMALYDGSVDDFYRKRLKFGV